MFLKINIGILFYLMLSDFYYYYAFNELPQGADPVKALDRAGIINEIIDLLVTGEIPAKSLAAGSPARVIKTLNIPDGWIRK
jgi:hypothetical protein